MAAVTPTHTAAPAVSCAPSPRHARSPRLLAGLMAAVLLGACGGGGGDSPAPAPAPAATPAPAPAPATPTARAWQTAERLRATDGPSNGTAGPVVAANANGAFIVAWVDADLGTGDRSLLTRRYTPGAGWGPTDVVASWTSADRPSFHGMSVGLAPNGTAAIAFIGRSNLRDSLYGSHQTAGGAWATPTLLEDDDLGSSFSRVALVMDNNGVATAVWGQDFDVFPAVFNTRRALAARMAANGTWGPYVDIDFPAGSGINGIGLTPRLAVNANGDVVAGWTTNIVAGPTAGQYAAATVFTQGGGWATPALLTTPVSGYNSVLEDVAIASDGSAAAAMHRTSPVVGENRSVLLARRAAGGAWGSAVEVDQTGAESLFSRVALANDGTAVVVWQQASAGGNLLYTNTVAAGGTVGTAGMLSASTGSIISGAMMQRDSTGNIVLVWGAYEPSYRLVSRVRDTAGNWGTQSGVWSLASNIGFDSDAALAVSADGSAAAAWHVLDGVGGAVPWVNVYR